MPHSLPVGSRDDSGVSKIAIALALSVLLHVAMLWKMPQVHVPSPELGERSGPLVVELAPPPRPPPVRPSAPSEPRRQAKPRESPPRVARARPQPPVLAQEQPAPVIVAPRPKVPAAPVAPSPPAETGDFSSDMKARQRARTEAAPPAAAAQPAPSAAAEDENARANRIAAANLGLNRKPSFGPERRSGGMFDLTYMAYDYAEFVFYGWNKDIQRNTPQRIEVRKGANSDIRIAVIRRMIAIIRDHEQEDFIWESQRLNRNVTLSARMRDNAELEAFLKREFFEDPRRPAFAR
jgi:hypothetical protein